MGKIKIDTDSKSGVGIKLKKVDITEIGVGIAALTQAWAGKLGISTYEAFDLAREVYDNRYVENEEQANNLINKIENMYFNQLKKESPDLDEFLREMIRDIEVGRAKRAKTEAEDGSTEQLS